MRGKTSFFERNEIGLCSFPTQRVAHATHHFQGRSIVDFFTPNRVNSAQMSQIIHTVNF
jgi:hypothetical protein